jgi:uncharacterized protein (PEP-CTERM system associated)
MATMVMGMVQKYKSYLITMLFLNHSLAFANEWTFEPSIETNETYSDNINFDDQNSESSFVNQTSIGLLSNYQSSKVDYNLDFKAISATYSHDSDLNDVHFTLNSNVDIRILTNGLSLVCSASIQNQSRNTADNLFSDIISGDTIQVELYTGGLSYSVANSSYTLNSNLIFNTTESEDGISESDGYTALINSQNGTNSKYIFWDITNNYTERKNNNSTGRSYQSEFKIGYITPYKFNPFIRYYDEGNSGTIENNTSESNSYGAGLRWLVLPRLTLDMSYNTPINEDTNNNQEAQDDYYDVNVSWQPTQRTSLNAGVSQRFFGDSFNFNLSHQNKRLSNTISYNESVQVFTRDGLGVRINGELCSFSDINLDCNALLQQSIIDNPQQPIPSLEITEDESFSLYKTFTWNSTLNLRRTTLTLDVNRSDRTNLSTPFKTLIKSIDFNASRQVSRYSNFDFSVTYTNNNLLIGSPSEREDQYRYYRMSYNRELNDKLTFDVSLSHLNRTSNDVEFMYKENRISLELKKVL